MSDFSLDDELVHEYLAESREHLATIETDLLAMEQAGAAIDEQLVNRVFRAAHSIKGGAGFFDLSKIRELAHKTENVLDMIRARQLVPLPEVVNILLLAFDQLSHLIDSYSTSNDAEISVFLNALTNISAGSLTSEQQTLLEQPASSAVPELKDFPEVTAFDLDQAVRAGKRVYIVGFDLLHDIQRRGKTPLAIFRLLMNCGQILDSAVDLQTFGTLDDEPVPSVVLQVLYATTLDAFNLSQLMELESEKIRIAVDIAPAAVAGPPAQAPPVQAPPVVAEKKEPAKAPPAPEAEAANPSSGDGGESRAQNGSGPAPSEATVRLNVSLLDSLMSLAGELVLSRNQLNEALASQDQREISASAHRIGLVTSELQEAVTLTRMQPVGTLFAKFPRLVRDLAKDLGKNVQLKLEGGDVEIDKSILEGLSDPLTHMVRNSVDHGIESPDVRAAAGKPSMGTITLRASHQAGQVVIEVADDGKGLAGEKIAASSVAKGLISAAEVQAMSDREKMALIFLPGVSTASTVSNVSGRGVGMDVVKTNLDKLGGKIEIESNPGNGSRFLIKLPLTLAIIPSLLVSQAGERFAIPQVSVGELIRIPASKIAERLDRAGNAEILTLRDRLVPLLRLADILGEPDSRGADRAMNIVLLDAGGSEYGLVVDQLHDTVEIVVKPLGRHLQGIRDYAGATILGNGEVALILDAVGIAERSGSMGGAQAASASREVGEETRELQSLLIFHNGPNEPCAVPIELVKRVEKLDPSRVENLGGRRTMQYEGQSLPLVMLKDIAAVSDLEMSQQWVVIVFERAGLPLGLLAAEPLDLIETAADLDTVTLRQPGIAGSVILGGRTTLMVDIFELAASMPGREGSLQVRAARTQRPVTEHQGQAAAKTPTVLIAEDSDFFRNQILRLVESVGYNAFAACDGQAAWELLTEHADEISLVATDVEMPRMDGLSLTRKIRADSRFSGLPIIALSSLAGEEEIARGVAAGVSEYQVKLDRDLFLDSIRKSLEVAL